ncbi:MAG: DUF1800 domain-containing protein [Dehalococcoidia bacterium]
MPPSRPARPLVLSFEDGPPDPPLPPGLPGQRAARALPWSAPLVGQSFAPPPPEVIVLHRAGFGPRPGDAERVRTIGVAAYLDEQLMPESIPDPDCDRRIAALAPQLTNLAVPALWLRRNLPDWRNQWQAFWETRTLAWLRAIYSRRQLFELLVDHWHNVFNVYAAQAPMVILWPDHDRRIRRNVFGNYRAFLEEIATSPAMLYYLDNSSSSAAGPNENFARELLELYTLGEAAYRPGTTPSEGNPAATYNDADVVAVARCFTGWTIRDRSWDSAFGDTGEFFIYAPWHDDGEKRVLGVRVPASQSALKDGRDVLDLLARHPATARQVATRLARRLVADRPTAGLVDAGAAEYLRQIDAPDQLRRVVRALLTHPDALSAWGEKVRRPFEAIVGFLRATNAEWTWTDPFDWLTASAGQRLWEWTAPNGYPDVRSAWTSSVQLVGRWSQFNSLAENWVEGTVIPILSVTPAGLRSPLELSAFWVERLLGYLPPEGDWEPLVRFLARGRDPSLPLTSDQIATRLPALMAMVFQLPGSQLR